jgi:AbrB family looped-hinge helix DNA binding protein
MSAKGQFALPKAIRERLKLHPGCKVDVSIDERNRLVLTADLHEPEELFADRPPVRRVVTLDEMEAAVAGAMRGSV